MKKELVEKVMTASKNTIDAKFGLSRDRYKTHIVSQKEYGFKPYSETGRKMIYEILSIGEKIKKAIIQEYGYDTAESDELIHELDGVLDDYRTYINGIVENLSESKDRAKLSNLLEKINRI